MAPNPRAAKGAKLLFNNADLSGILQEVTMSASVPALDTTVFGNDDKTCIAGVRDGSVNYSGLFDGTALSTASTASTGALDHRFAAALAASTQPIVTYGPEGDTLGRRARLFKQETMEYTAGSPANDVVKVSAAGAVSDRVGYGVWLHALAARTSTSSTFSGVNSGIAAGTTGGGVGHFHMTAGSTITTFQVIIQHSSSGSTWPTLITFSSSTGTTASGSAQRVAVTTTVKRHVRAAIPVFTGGAAKSATFAVGFARFSNRPF